MASYALTAARTHLGELVAQARHTHRPVTITEHGKPVVALINIDDLADLEDRAALAAHFAVPASRNFVRALHPLAAGTPDIQIYDATKLESL